MATYYVDDGGSNTSTYDTWAKAATSIFNLPTLAHGDIVYIGADSVDTTSYGGSQTLTGPSTNGVGVSVISVTQGTTTYAKATANQIDTTQAGSYQVTFTGAFVFHGVQIAYGSTLTANTNTEWQRYWDCKFVPGHSRQINMSGNGGTAIIGGEIDCTADTSTVTPPAVAVSGHSYIVGVTVSNFDRRSTRIFINNGDGDKTITGCDLTSATHASVPVVYEALSDNGVISISHCKTTATHELYSITGSDNQFQLSMTNVGNGDQPTQFVWANDQGDLANDTAIYRTGGGTVEGTAISWGGPSLGIETSAICSFDNPFYTPWVPIVIGTTGTKTIDIYIANNSQSMSDDDMWIEVEHADTTSQGMWAFSTEKPAKGATGSAHATDATSTWNGDTFTYKQKMSLGSITVNTTGLQRVRVAIALTSLADTADLYIDPLPVVT